VTPGSPPKGLLLDIGDTLTRPIGGRWNPRFDFEQVLARHLPPVDPARFPAAFAAGERFLEESEHTPARDAYHRVMLGHLGIDEPSAALLEELDRPRPFSEVVDLFDDVEPVLSELRRRGVPIAVVSDGWASPTPGLPVCSPDAYPTMGDIGLHRFLDVVVFSEVLGCRKPDPRMFHTASEDLGLSAPDCLFVDNAAELVEAAVALGYQGRVIVRDGPPPPTSAPTISSLTELLELF
jgi:putative hydrolase of the HAD superfamily